MALNDINNRNIRYKDSDTPENLKENAQKKRVDQEKKIQDELLEYKYLLERQSTKVSLAQQKKLLDAYEKHRKQLLDKEIKRREKDALALEDKIFAERWKEREKEHKHELELQQQRMDALKEQFQSATNIGDKMSAWTKLLGETFKQQFSKANLLKGAVEGFNTAMNKASSEMKQVFDTYSKYQTTISTRLQGSGRSFNSLEDSLLGKVGVTPYIKTQTLMDNLTALVESGIAFNLEQRAFLQTISDKVATTFNAANSSLLRIVKLQQQDSTASRLGMEAFLTKFLNNLFENTEYLSDSFDEVTNNLVEATSQLSTTMGVEFEYQVQKWLGSLSSVGLSGNTISSLSTALGALQTGNIQNLESSGMQNLIVMAASRAGLSYADMLSRGINIDETNKLLGSIVQYLQEIGSNTNRVVRNQYAQTFGVSISDLAAAQNISASRLKAISESSLSYGNMISELQSQMGKVYSRTSMSDLINTFIENLQFSLYSNIANNPVTSAIWKITDMIQEYTGGINIPFVTTVGSGVDLNTTVENLIKLGVMGVGSIGMIGDIVSGLGNTVDFSNTLNRLGINKGIATVRGGGNQLATSGFTTSTSTFIGQSSGESIYPQTLAAEKAKTTSDIESGKVTVSQDVDMKKDIADVISSMNTTLTNILQTLQGTLRVNVTNYGLTNEPNI